MSELDVICEKFEILCSLSVGFNCDKVEVDIGELMLLVDSWRCKEWV